MEQNVQDVMTRDVVSVVAGTSYRQAVRVVQERHVDALPVVDEDCHVVGIVTVGDLLLKQESVQGASRLPWQRRRAAARTVADCMTRKPVVVGPQTSLCTASRLMHRHRVGGLPVVGADRRLTGIVTRSDLLRVFLHEDDEVCAEVQRALGPDARGVSCTVTDGHVRLEGHVHWRSEVLRAVARVRPLHGVVSIEEHVSSDVDDVDGALAGY